jgi:hypothetical protein
MREPMAPRIAPGRHSGSPQLSSCWGGRQRRLQQGDELPTPQSPQQSAGMSGGGGADALVWDEFYDKTLDRLRVEELETEFARLWGRDVDGIDAPSDEQALDQEASARTRGPTIVARPLSPRSRSAGLSVPPLLGLHREFSNGAR